MAILEKGVTGEIQVSVNEVEFTNETEIIVNHNLNKNVIVQVLSSDGEFITTGVDIDVLSKNEFRVSGTIAFSGTIIYF